MLFTDDTMCNSPHPMQRVAKDDRAAFLSHGVLRWGKKSRAPVCAARPWMLLATGCTLVVLTGCASTYGNLVSGSNLGAMEYQPAVLKQPGMEGNYNEILQVCRQVAVNRQVTAAQEAQLKTLTGTGSGALRGSAMGLQMGSIFKQAGFNTSTTKQLGIGAVAGALGGLADSFASGANDGASETKRILLACLRSADPGQKFYKVLE